MPGLSRSRALAAAAFSKLLVSVAVFQRINVAPLAAALGFRSPRASGRNPSPLQALLGFNLGGFYCAEMTRLTSLERTGLVNPPWLCTNTQRFGMVSKEGFLYRFSSWTPLPQAILEERDFPAAPGELHQCEASLSHPSASDKAAGNGVAERQPW